MSHPIGPNPTGRMRSIEDPFLAALTAELEPRLRNRISDRLAMAHDASHYLLTPRAVVAPTSADEVAAAIRVALAHDVGVTFRSGGTSLSGQGVTDQLMIDTRRHFREVEVLDNGERVRVQPGVTVRQLNAHLAPYGRKFGPDPASEVACTIGGVVANNSSGMLCGTWANSYRTLDSAILVLPTGITVDTGRTDADEWLRHQAPELWQGLSQLRDQVRANPDWVERITALFAIKNTMGYGINSFLDHDRAVDILAHLVVGSEGTLAWVAEATFRTLPLHTEIATGLLVFDNLHAATDALPALVDSGLAAIELLDAASLRVASTDPQAPGLITQLDVDQHAALLVEHQRADGAELADAVDRTQSVVGRLRLAEAGEMTPDAKTRKGFWHVRKNLYAAVAGARPSGTTALLEDIAVPVENLADTCGELEQLFDRYDYDGSVIFGHARDGNIHFLINERFDQPGRLDRYDAFTEDMVEAVLSRGGTLKAEHGTGRIMAPFVERQYGSDLYAVMRQVKQLCDPTGVLNPGVLITDDKQAHVKHLKETPTVEEEVDRCVECGYCEPVCPSRDLTLTPRQRIVLRREQARAEAAGETELARQIAKDYSYDGLQTCAVDGMCATACPVLINTGDLVRRLRAEGTGAAPQAGWKAAAQHWDGFTRIASTGLSVADAVPSVLPKAATAVARAVAGKDNVPLITGDLPKGGDRRLPLRADDPAAVFFPSCTATMFGAQALGSSGAFLALCERAGVEVRVPDQIGSLCCGTPWKSKGMTKGLSVMADRVADALWEATDHGRLPVVVDAASCTEGLREVHHDHPVGQQVTFIDAVHFVREKVAPGLSVTSRIDSIVLHPTCATTRLGVDGDLVALAELVAEDVTVPKAWGCCAFAGDRGMLHPELTASATAEEAAEVATLNGTAHASANRTCEIGMSRATGKDYVHVLELVEQHTR